MDIETKSAISEDKLTTAGLLGLCTVALIQLVSMDTLDASLWVSLYCFSIAIPLLAGTYFMVESRSRSEGSVQKWYYDLIGYGGLFTGFAGIAGLFWHFSWIVSVLFTVLAFIVVALWSDYADSLDEVNKEHQEQHTHNE